jgi:hypothetical protein
MFLKSSDIIFIKKGIIKSSFKDNLIIQGYMNVFKKRDGTKEKRAKKITILCYAIKDFWKKNRIISVAIVISVLFVIFSICFENYLPGWISKGFNLVVQLSIGIIINFLFFLTLIYFPSQKKKKDVYPCIRRQINKIEQGMHNPLEYIAKLYLAKEKADVFNSDDLNSIKNFNFNDKVNVIKASSISQEHFTLREWIIKNIDITEKNIDRLYSYYSLFISEEMMVILDSILYSQYHEMLRVLCQVQTNMSFASGNTKFLSNYHELYIKLKELANKQFI